MVKHKILYLAFIALISVSCTTSDNQWSEEMNGLPTDQKDSDGHGCDISMYKTFLVSHYIETNLITSFTPTYPEDARKNRVSGRVNVHIMVNPDGDVFKACSLDGPESLRQTAEEAALKFKFRQREQSENSEVSYALTVVSFNFKMAGDETSVESEDSEIGINK